jgi:hypothetical protein
VGGPRKARTATEKQQQTFIIIKEDIDMRLNRVKRTIMATALAVATAVAGVAGQAQAFTYGQNDLVLAIYGNNTEALYNVGTYSSLLAGPNMDITVGTAGLTAASVGTPSAVKWTLFGWDLSLPDGQIHAATAFTPAQITGALDFTSQFNPSTAWSGGFTGDTVSKGSSLSFSSNLNTAGAGKFEGAWPVAMQGSVDQVLNIMRGNVALNTFTQVGRVQFTSEGHLIIGNPGPTAVPLPAGVVLFGTGIIALIGIARRSFKQMAA